MEINQKTLRETTRSLSVPKIAADCNLYEKEENVNNCNKSLSKSTSSILKQRPFISR
jgi:hypothetical protein